MTPELAIVLGIVLGHEAFDYFKKFADPQKMLVVQPRPQQQNPQAQQPQGQAQATPQPTQASTPPARSIMGR